MSSILCEFIVLLAVLFSGRHSESPASILPCLLPPLLSHPLTPCSCSLYPYCTSSAWQFQPRHPSDVLTVPSLYKSKPSPSGLSGYISKASSMRCPSDLLLIPDPIHPCYSQRETGHFSLCYLQFSFLSFPQCDNL